MRGKIERGCGAIAGGAEIRNRNRVDLAFVCNAEHAHQPAGVGRVDVGQQESIGLAEDRQVRADAKAKRQHRDRGRQRLTAKSTERVMHIADPAHEESLPESQMGTGGQGVARRQAPAVERGTKDGGGNSRPGDGARHGVVAGAKRWRPVDPQVGDGRIEDPLAHRRRRERSAPPQPALSHGSLSMPDGPAPAASRRTPASRPPPESPPG